MTAAPLLLLLLAGQPAVVELAPEAETAMALSAAPAELRAGAGVYRLGAAGFERVRPSTNGYECLVERAPSQGLEPVCYDAEGTATILQAQLLRGELLRRGTPDDTVEAEVEARFRDGRLSAPRHAGVAYMLSHDFSRYDARLGRRSCVYPPHVMIYAPYRRNADIGNAPSDFGSMTRPWILNEGRPDAYIIVPMTHDGGASCQ